MNGRHKKDKGGRPKGDPAAVRDITIGVRVNAAEREALNRKAKHMGMSPSQWLRMAALQRKLPPPPVPAANLEAYGLLSRLAINFNQVARSANEGRAVVSPSLLLGVREEIIKLQQALLGEAP